MSSAGLRNRSVGLGMFVCYLSDPALIPLLRFGGRPPAAKILCPNDHTNNCGHHTCCGETAPPPHPGQFSYVAIPGHLADPHVRAYRQITKDRKRHPQVLQNVQSIASHCDSRRCPKRTCAQDGIHRTREGDPKNAPIGVVGGIDIPARIHSDSQQVLIPFSLGDRTGAERGHRSVHGYTPDVRTIG